MRGHIMNVSGARAVATAGGRRCGWRDERKSRRGRGRRRRSGSIRTEYVHGSKLIRVTCTRSLHAIASAKGTFSIKTLNVLCPTYKRLRVQDDCGCEAASTSSESERESSYESIFMKRQKALISAICLDASSIMCFQVTKIRKFVLYFRNTLRINEETISYELSEMTNMVSSSFFISVK